GTGAASEFSRASRLTDIDRVPGCFRIPVKRLDGLKRILLEILADQPQLREQIMGDGDDVATDCIGFGLPHHFARLIGEDLERNRTVRNNRKQAAGEVLVVFDTGFAHQARICRKTMDQRVLVEREDALEIRPIGENLHAETTELLHLLSPTPQLETYASLRASRQQSSIFSSSRS